MKSLTAVNSYLSLLEMMDKEKLTEVDSVKIKSEIEMIKLLANNRLAIEKYDMLRIEVYQQIIGWYLKDE
jgi:hypothetical protein